MGDIINKADKNKCTALHYAAVAGDGEVQYVRLLILNFTRC